MQSAYCDLVLVVWTICLVEARLSLTKKNASYVLILCLCTLLQKKMHTEQEKIVEQYN
jgi:hypothetical protein